MKPRFFALVGLFIALLLTPSFSHPNEFNSNKSTCQEPHYVVIGAFSSKPNALKFTSFANKLANLSGHAAFELNPNRNLFYVYVLITEDHEKAITEANRLRNETQFSDTWVYHGGLGNALSQKQESKGVDINPTTEQTIENVNLSDDKKQLIDPDKLMASSSTTQIQPSEEISKEKIKADETAEGKKFYFKLYRAVDQETVNGEVDVIDIDRSRKMGAYQSNVPVFITSPLNKSGEITISCDVFGYRKMQRKIVYDSPKAEDVIVDENKSTVVPFELVRLQKGDIAVMYNVYFFKDAGVMRPESRFEVNNLLEMLKENPKYKIKIHGHTNGSAAGKIISIGETKNYFSLTGTKESVGTAKKLSNERAEVIRAYMIENGIEPSRMQIKAWGGKRPIHDKHSNRAQENVRVEIEILEN